MEGNTGGQATGDPGVFFGPRGIAADKDGRVLVSDTGNKRVQIFDTNGVYQAEFGTGGMTDGALDEPVGIAFGPDGLAYVADTWNLRVDVFDPQTLAFVRKWTVTAWYGQSTENKPYIAVDGQGRVYVTAPEQYRVMAYDAQGTPALCWGQLGSDASSFGEPLGIATDKDGNVYVVDTTQNRVLKFAVP
jgi:DNA-binding beta-propeller fold protein YncE